MLSFTIDVFISAQFQFIQWPYKNAYLVTHLAPAETAEA
jgi:hypothetical protein